MISDGMLGNVLTQVVCNLILDRRKASIKQASFLEKFDYPKKTKSMFFLDTSFWMVTGCLPVKSYPEKTQIWRFWITLRNGLIGQQMAMILASKWPANGHDYYIVKASPNSGKMSRDQRVSTDRPCGKASWGMLSPPGWRSYCRGRCDLEIWAQCTSDVSHASRNETESNRFPRCNHRLSRLWRRLCPPVSHPMTQFPDASHRQW